MTLPQLKTEDELCAYLGKSKAWAQRSRLDGSGPSFIKVGRKPLYRLDAIHSWLESRTRTSTSDQGGRK
ncbi:helix-turn-helix transcriptional regulator, partial [Desulfonatronum thiodismutans]|uniref:helix-turn-helix transcriptional regulator n=1 Tax=Desulfonatronum thiodismutans TaxID=159290 RepID=UPI0004DB8F2F